MTTYFECPGLLKHATRVHCRNIMVAVDDYSANRSREYLRQQEAICFILLNCLEDTAVTIHRAQAKYYKQACDWGM